MYDELEKPLRELALSEPLAERARLMTNAPAANAPNGIKLVRVISVDSVTDEARLEVHFFNVNYLTDIVTKYNAVNGTDFDKGMRNQIKALRAIGGDVAVSFGGASGRDLAEVVTDVKSLTAAYHSVIRAYGLTHIDFDIEGAPEANRAAIDRRSQAIATLQHEATAAGRELNVRFTLPVLPTGLTADGLYVLQSAKQYGARVDLVNIMAMDYGDSAAPNPAGHMGDYAIQAATSLYGQLTTLYATSKTDAERWAMIGVTPMIGKNDLTNEVFDQQAARELEAWAAQHHIGMLSMWSINRDKQNAAGAISYVDLTSSSLVQSPFEFSSIFEAFSS